MATQPNIQVDPADRPRRSLQPAPARLGADTRPGVISTPEAMPRGPGFGTPAPDAGYGLRLVRGLEEEIDPDLAAVLAALMTARASHFGRAPVIQDIEVAKLLVGMGDGLPTELVERATRWTDAVPHEVSKGRSAVDGVDVTQLAMSPDALRTALVSR